MESNPTGFITEGFNEAEEGCGVAGQPLLDAQWAEVEVVDYKKFTEGTPVLKPMLRLTENSKQPNRRMSASLWFTDKQYSQMTVDGWCVAAGVGKPPNTIGPKLATKKGEATLDKLQRPPAPTVEGMMDMVGQALKGRRFIASINVEVDKDGQYDDKNGINGYHKVTEENILAIRAANYEPKGVVVQEKKEGGKVVRRFLEATKSSTKKGGTGTSAGAAPKYIE